MLLPVSNGIFSLPLDFDGGNNTKLLFNYFGPSRRFSGAAACRRYYRFHPGRRSCRPGSCRPFSFFAGAFRVFPGDAPGVFSLFLFFEMFDVI